MDLLSTCDYGERPSANWAMVPVIFLSQVYTNKIPICYVSYISKMFCLWFITSLATTKDKFIDMFNKSNEQLLLVDLKTQEPQQYRKNFDEVVI